MTAEPGTELNVEGRRFWRMLVTHFRAGNLMWRPNQRAVRTVAKVQTVTRVFYDPVEGRPDLPEFEDFPLEGIDARQWGSKGIPMHGPSMSHAALEASWEVRNQAISQGEPPYPRGG